MSRRKQLGFMAVSDSDMWGCLIITVVVLVGIGIVIGLGFPWFWSTIVKPALLWLATLGG